MPSFDINSNIDYKDGRIYVAVINRKFRVICVRGDYYTEKQASWGDDPESAWANTLLIVADYVPR